ncbi:MAG: response regulator [Elusimicrobiales bacterium]|nr:response regulator [Elusimicrobiales bacterium]
MGNRNGAPAKLLVVDDEQGIRDMLSYELGLRGYQVATADNGADALEEIKKDKFRLVISDVKMAGMDGLQLLEAVKKSAPDVEVIMSTGYGTIEMAVSAMKKGAYDFIQKPFDLEELLALIEKALEKNELRSMLGVYEASKAVMSSIKLHELLPLLAKLSARVLKADGACIMLLSPEGKLGVAAVHGRDGEEYRAYALALGERAAGKASPGAEPVLINGPLEDVAEFAGITGLRDVSSSMVYPLAMGGKVLGVLTVDRAGRGDLFTASDLRYAAVFCSHLSLAINNAALFRELEKRLEEIQRMQSRLIHSEKMAAIGQLAAGIAHEINNPLAGIMGFAEMLLKDGGLAAQQREDVETIYQQSMRCGNIVRNLLLFSRRKNGKETAVNVLPVLDAALQLSAFELEGAGIKVSKAFQENLPAVMCDPAQLEQVFLNLIMNARQAMDGKTGAELKLLASSCGGDIVLRFEDNGRGISPESIGKVFDPFFTTSTEGKGTGLGLSISSGIIQQCEGTISAESRPGEGAAFIVTLPAFKEKGDGTI